MQGKELNVPTILIVVITRQMTAAKYVTRNTRRIVTIIERWRPQRTDTRSMTRPSAMPSETMHKVNIAAVA